MALSEREAGAALCSLRSSPDALERVRGPHSSSFITPEASVERSNSL